MAWTTPRTWTSTELVTASIFNTHVRDNFNETAPAKSSVSGRVLMSAGGNTVAARVFDAAETISSQTTASTSYTDLGTVGPTFSVSTGTRAMIWLGAQLSNDTAGGQSFMSVEVSGATAISPGDSLAAMYESSNANDIATIGAPPIELALTAGTNTFTAKYRVSSGTGTFHRRRLAVFPL